MHLLIGSNFGASSFRISETLGSGDLAQVSTTQPGGLSIILQNLRHYQNSPLEARTKDIIMRKPGFQLFAILAESYRIPPSPDSSSINSSPRWGEDLFYFLFHKTILPASIARPSLHVSMARRQETYKGPRLDRRVSV